MICAFQNKHVNIERQLKKRGRRRKVARIDDYKESFRLASEELKSANLHGLAKLAEVAIGFPEKGTPTMCVPFFGTPYYVLVGEKVDIQRAEDHTEVPLPEKILLCHYLLHASGKPPTGELITFRQISDGHFYFEAFQRRARDPFLATFGRQPELFRRCAQSLGGQPAAAGDVAMVFQVLPRISIHLALWEGDDEFPPEASILFDANIQHELAAEDVAVLSGMLVYRLMGIARRPEAVSSKQ
jgi:hypothetical protein